MSASSMSFAGFLVGWLADYYLAATLLLLVSFAGWRWVRQPAHRLMVAWSVMIELIALAVVCGLPFWPKVSLIVTTSPAAEAVVEPPTASEPDFVPPPVQFDPVVKVEDFVRQAPDGPEPSLPASPPIVPERRLTWVEWIADGYLVGAVLLGLWLCWGAAATMLTCQRARPASDRLRAELCQVVQGQGRVPRLLISSHIANAVALGVFRPAIVLPAGLAENSPSQTLRVVLSHEWAHLRNRDLWLLALGRCLLVVLFAQPLFWWLRRAIRGDQELLADAMAAGEERHDYAEELLRLVRTAAGRRPLAISTTMGIWEGPSQLSRRIAMLLDETFRVEPTGSRRWKCQAVGVLVLLGVGCSLLTLQPARSADVPAQAVALAESKPEKQAEPTVAMPRERNLPADNTPFVMATVPGRMLLSRRSVQAELKLTDEQKQKLSQIVADFLVEQRRVVPPRHYPQSPPLKLTEEPSPHAPLAELQQDMRKLDSDTCKKMDAVLTPQQLQMLKDLKLRTEAFNILFDPAVLDKLGMTTEQRVEWIRRVVQLMNESQRKGQQASRKINGQALAVLSPQQRAQLQSQVFRPGSDSLRMFRMADIAGVPLPNFSPFPFPDLSREDACKELNLSTAQQDQVRAVMKKYNERSQELTRQWRALSDESNANWRTSRKDRSAVSEKSRQLIAEHKRQIEGILTPRQLESYKEMALREVALNVLNDPRTLGQIGATKEQNAALSRLQMESIDKPEQITREMADKALKSLTPAQQEMLRAEVDRDMREPSASPVESKAQKNAGGSERKSASSEAFQMRTFGTVSGYNATTPSAHDDQISLIYLPGYLLMLQRGVLKALNLTAEQTKKLRGIASKHSAEVYKFYKDRKSLPQDVQTKARAQWDREQLSGIRKQVEAVLTPQQSQTLRRFALCNAAFSRLNGPDLLRKFGLTKEQQSALLLIRKEAYDRMRRNSKETEDKMLAVLSPQQRTQLRAAVLGPLWPERYPEIAVHVAGETEPIWVPLLFPYPDFSFGSMRKALGLTAAQQARVRDILGDRLSLSQKLVEQWQKLSVEERKRCQRGFGRLTLSGGKFSANVSAAEQKKQQAAYEEKLKKERQAWRSELENQPLVKRSIELRKQFEGLLTPEQLAKYKDMAVQNGTKIAVRDLLVQREIGASDQQMAAIQRLRIGSMEKLEQLQCEMGEKVLKVLTPTQQEQFRAEIDRDVSQPSAPPAKPKPANKTVRSGVTLAGRATHHTGGVFHLVRGNITWIGSIAVPLMYDDYDKNFYISWGAHTVVLPKHAEGIRSFYGQRTLFPGVGRMDSAGGHPPSGQPANLVMPGAVDLPAYQLLLQPFVQQALNLSAGQRTRLQDISAKYWPERRQIAGKELADMESTAQKELSLESDKAHWSAGMVRSTPVADVGGSSSAFSKEVVEKLERQWSSARTQIEEVLTPEQLRTLKELTFRTFAFGSGVMFEPKVLGSLGVSKSQQEALRALEAQLQKEKGRRLRSVPREKVAKMLAVLTPRQQSQLREKHSPDKKPETDCSMYPYPMLPSHMPDTGVAEDLGFSPEQRERVRKIVTEHWMTLIALQQEEQKLALGDEKAFKAIGEKRRQEMANLRKQIETVLTPEQWASCKEMAFQNLAIPSLRIVAGIAQPPNKLGPTERPGMAAYIALASGKMGLSEQQRAALREIDAKYFDKPEQIYRELTDKALTAFTPAQQEKLRAEVDRRGW